MRKKSEIMMSQNKKKILVADDDEAILDALILILEDAGYEVEATDNGMTIRDSLSNSPDLLLLDIRMSGWNGRDICRYLKSQEATKHIPIILFSANRDTEKLAREAGADDFITKPFDIDELLEKIEQLI
jgi:DNA-binding response OmpR family regulator